MRSDLTSHTLELSKQKFLQSETKNSVFFFGRRVDFIGKISMVWGRNVYYHNKHKTFPSLFNFSPFRRK